MKPTPLANPFIPKPNPRRNKVVSVRMTHEQHALIKRIADRDGGGLQNLIHEALAILVERKGGGRR